MAKGTQKKKKVIDVPPVKVTVCEESSVCVGNCLMKTHEPSRQNLNSKKQWMVGGWVGGWGCRINKSVPAPEDNDNVLTFY